MKARYDFTREWWDFKWKGLTEIPTWSYPKRKWNFEKYKCVKMFEEKWGSIFKTWFVLKENESLKNKIISISKELDLVSKKNNSLKNNIDSHVCHAPSCSIPITCSTCSWYIHVKEECWLFGLHFEPMCYGS